ncbi:MAG: hypothetical protein ACK5X3_15540 [Pseudomonadota bacterium]|jgi:hypothetical protein
MDAPVSRRAIALALLALGLMAWGLVQAVLVLITDLSVPMV